MGVAPVVEEQMVVLPLVVGRVTPQLVVLFEVRDCI
jgi:hypothetical protein